MSLAAAIAFRCALALCPPGFRREYGAAMRADFVRAYEEERTLHGAVGAVAYTFGALTDLLTTAVREYAAMLFRDFVYALRSLRKTPSFTAVVVGTLALAIGANASVFSVLHAVVLSPLPYSDPDRLATFEVTSHGKHTSFSLPNFADFEKGTRTVFESMAAYRSQAYTLTGLGVPRRVNAIEATAALFATLGAQPELGRFATPNDTFKGSARVAVISDALWRSGFSANPSTVGSIIRLDGLAYRVIGIVPASFNQPRNALGFQRSDAWTFVPDNGAGTGDESSRGYNAFDCVARLHSGVSLPTARDVARRAATLLADRYPAENAAIAIATMSLTDSLVGGVRALLFAMFAAVGAVLLVACANVANLLLSRAASREREFSVRIAIGASRGRIVAQLLVETFVLAGFGGVLGIALAYGIVSAFVAYHPANIPRGDLAVVNGISIAYTFGIVAFCTIAAGLAPAFASSQRNIASALKSAGRGGDASRGARARNILVACEIAATLALVVAAGLITRSFIALTSQPLGFDPAGLAIVGDYDLPSVRYSADGNVVAFQTRALAKARAVPGVGGAAFVFAPPFWHNHIGTDFAVRGRVDRPGYEPIADISLVSSGYFHVIGATLLEGREFTADDRAGALPVAIVNESFAREFLGNGPFAGKQIKADVASGNGAPPFRTIVGVVADVRTSFTKALEPTIYVSEAQLPIGSGSLVIRALPGTDPGAAVAAAIATVDPQLPVATVNPYSTLLASNVAVQKLSVAALFSLAFVALALSLAGVFAVVSYGVTQRTHEFGVRMALGADARQIVRMVMAGAMRLALIGTAIGLLVAASGTRFLADQLYDTQPLDPLTFGSVTVFVMIAALVAAIVPARRATRVDPIVALRYE